MVPIWASWAGAMAGPCSPGPRVRPSETSAMRRSRTRLMMTFWICAAEIGKAFSMRMSWASMSSVCWPTAAYSVAWPSASV